MDPVSSVAITMDLPDAGKPAHSLQAKEYSPAAAMHRASAMIQNNLFGQSNMLAYVDCFWLLGAAILGMIPLVFLMKKAHSGGEISVH